MTKVVARLELVLAWTLQDRASAHDQKHIGRTIFFEKAWSLFMIKTPKGRMSSPIEKLGKSINNKNESILMEKHATTVVEGGCESGGIATASQQVVLLLPTGQTEIPNLKVFTFSELKNATRNFRPDFLLGEGGFGSVYKGWLDSETLVPRKPYDGLAVAIKKSSRESLQGYSEWQAEVDFLGTFSHPHLVKLFGYCEEKDEFLLVYEFMQRGSLEWHLFKKIAEPLSWETRIKIAMGAAQGLAFLHRTENNVIYRDVKSSNILLDGEFNAKLTDFGLAKLGPVKGEYYVPTRVMGTYGYAAPEYLATGHFYLKSDVYGMLPKKNGKNSLAEAGIDLKYVAIICIQP
ncbi:hypothetical protein L1887_16238 [Cichorium endivia]|nr:hypothetical protein L1887_16238 [Cichorium endivia]